MATLKGRRIEQEVMLRQIEDVLRRGRPEDPPAYTLVLGAGASFGAVPTAKQMLGIADKGAIHEDCIPAFLHQRRHDGKLIPGKLTRDELPQVVRDFWKGFFVANPDLDTAITRDAEGLPNNASIADAYKAIFDQRRTAGINTPAGAREYLRTITLPREARSVSLNGTHFFLASLLSLQRRINEKADDHQPLYVGQRSFARTIFTTNFDPLLQVSLQLFQLLYYMTDRPELLAADGLDSEDQSALHLFYAHGSVHRPFLANTDAEIAHLRGNARDLAGYLGQHGVIVLGYAGWDDCLLHAMKEIRSFGNNLYWLARGEDSITPEVERFLCSRPNAFWVQIADGGEFMAALHGRLCPGMPFTELLHNPIPFVRQGLERVSLGDIAVTPLVTGSVGPELNGPTGPVEKPPSPEKLRRQVVALLEESARNFVDVTVAGSPGTQLKRLEHQADLAYAEKKWSTAIELCGKLIGYPAPGASVQQVATALSTRGGCYEKQGKDAEAIADYTRVIELKAAPVEKVGWAYFNRGRCYGEKGKDAEASADYSRVIDLPGTPTQLVALALVKRGHGYSRDGKDAEASADYSRIILLPGLLPEFVAISYLGRAMIFRKAGNRAAAQVDFEAALRMPELDADLAMFARECLLEFEESGAVTKRSVAKKKPPRTARIAGRKGGR